jgi:hypothetical protein
VPQQSQPRPCTFNTVCLPRINLCRRKRQRFSPRHSWLKHLGVFLPPMGIRDIEPLAVGSRLPLDCQACEVRHEEDVARVEFMTYVPFGQRYLTFEHVNDGWEGASLTSSSWRFRVGGLATALRFKPVVRSL